MPVSARELLLIVRMKDQASSVLRGLSRDFSTLDAKAQAAAQKHLMAGAALATVGIGLAGAGAAGLAFLAHATQAAVEYNRTAALTMTQTDKVKTSVKELAAVGLEVATSIGAPLDQLQPALYDIFSSMDVNVPQAKQLLVAFAKSAVAGQVDVQTAGRATIALMNAFHVPIGDVNKVMDFQFQLVRKGVGTYQQFATTIGRAIPSAVRAGQTYQQLGGMLAFLTRNGLSAAMAAASSQRALDAITNAGSVKKLKELGDTIDKALGPGTAKKLAAAGDGWAKMGVQVYDAQGKTRPMTAIMTDLYKALQPMTKPQKVAVLQELFKGSGGTIQARRFFDLVLSGNASLQQFIGLTKSMNQSGGAASKAYGQMADTMAVKQQLLNNRWQAAKIQIGQALIPILAALINFLSKLLGWWQRLSDTQKKWIAIGLLIASVMAIVIGVVTALAGVFIMLSAAAAIIGVSLGALIGIPLLIVAAIAALIVVVILLWKNWGTVWGFIKRIAQDVANAVVAAWNWVVGVTVSVWTTIVSWVTTAVTSVWNVVTSVFNAIFNFFRAVWGTNIIQAAVQVLGVFYQLFRINFMLILAFVRTTAMALWMALKVAFELIKWIVTSTWAVVVAATRVAWNVWKTLVLTPARYVVTTLGSAIGGIVGMIQNHWDTIKAGATLAWNAFKDAVVNPVKDAASAIYTWVTNILSTINDFYGKVAKVAGAIKSALSKINPASHFSPSLVERTDQGFKALHSVTNAGLYRILGTAQDKGNQIRDNLRYYGTADMSAAGPTGAGAWGKQINQQITIHTNEIDPRQHAAELGWELARRAG